jgi:hypothetical protein
MTDHIFLVSTGAYWKVQSYILRSSMHAPTALVYPLSCCSKFLFQQAVLFLQFQALAYFCGHMYSQSLLDLDQCSLSQHTFFIPEQLMVCSEQEICICINEQNNSWSHRSVASWPIEWQKKNRGTPLFCARLLYNVHVRRTQRQQRCTDARPGQRTRWARMGLDLTNQ